MKRRYKTYLKINVVSLVFIVVSFISVTLAWFAYSGLSSAAVEVNVKAWYIELEKDGETVSNDIVISLDNIYPGMDPVSEIVKIKNKGDSDAQVNYSIESARILDIDNYTIDGEITTEYVEDKLSHEYPFHININLSKNYILSKTDESIFDVSISWPLDSESDEDDSYWGTEAYKFQDNEAALHITDITYQIRPSIKIVIKIKAEQYIESDTTSDVNYNLGDEILFDVSTNSRCTTVSDTCLKTNIIDVNNKQHDSKVTLLPDINTTYINNTFDNYDTSFNSLIENWNKEIELYSEENNNPDNFNKTIVRTLSVKDILKISSLDINNSFLIRDNMSNTIIGNLNYNNQVFGGINRDIPYNTRIDAEIARVIYYNGYYTFSTKYNYLVSNTCYWTNSSYNDDKAFAVKPIDNSNLKLYGEEKTMLCKVLPVIEVSKSKL